MSNSASPPAEPGVYLSANYFQLRRFFREVGFSQIFDQFKILDQEDIIHPSFWKKMILKMTKKFWSLKVMGLVFSPGTLFMCIK